MFSGGGGAPPTTENKLNPRFGGCDDTLANSEDKEHQYFENFRRINRQIF